MRVEDLASFRQIHVVKDRVRNQRLESGACHRERLVIPFNLGEEPEKLLLRSKAEPDVDSPPKSTFFIKHLTF